jgi:putative addiction module component (TIGR02574 family)
MNKAIFEQALKMPPNERVMLAELILSSIDHEESEVRDAWLSEVGDRIKAVNEGKAKLLDFESRYNEDQNS